VVKFQVRVGSPPKSPPNVLPEVPWPVSSRGLAILAATIEPCKLSAQRAVGRSSRPAARVAARRAIVAIVANLRPAHQLRCLSPPLIFHAFSNADLDRLREGLSPEKRERKCCCIEIYGGTIRRERRGWTMCSSRQQRAVGVLLRPTATVATTIAKGAIVANLRPAHQLRCLSPLLIFHAFSNADIERLREGLSPKKREIKCCCIEIYGSTIWRDRRGWTTHGPRSATCRWWFVATDCEGCAMSAYWGEETLSTCFILLRSPVPLLLSAVPPRAAIRGESKRQCGVC